MSGDSGARRLWQDKAREAGGETLVELLNEIKAGQIKLGERMEHMEQRFDDHLKEAFPGGDPEGHRRYHETQIELLTERRRLRAAILEKSLSGIIWAALVGLGMAAWEHIKREIVK